MKNSFVIYMFLNLILLGGFLRADDLFHAIVNLDVEMVESILGERTFTVQEKSSYIALCEKRIRNYELEAKIAVFTPSIRTKLATLVASLISIYQIHLAARYDVQKNYSHTHLNELNITVIEQPNFNKSLVAWVIVSLSALPDFGLNKEAKERLDVSNEIHDRLLLATVKEI